MAITYITIKMKLNYFAKRMEIHDDTNMFVTSIMESLVVPVNTEGIMGAGLAREAAYRLQATNYKEEYQKWCSPRAKQHRMKPGMIQAWKIPYGSNSGIKAKRILNAATKGNPFSNSDIACIEQILKTLRSKIVAKKIKSIALPQLGCALPQLGYSPDHLKWSDVGPLYAKYLGDLEIPVHVYVKAGSAPYQLAEDGSVFINYPPSNVEELPAVAVEELPSVADIPLTSSLVVYEGSGTPAIIDAAKTVRIRFPSINDQSNHLPGRNFKMICAKPAAGYENIDLLAPHADDLWAHKGGVISTEEYRRRLAKKLEADMVVIEMFFLSLKGQPGNHNFGCFCRAGAIQPHKYCHREDIFGLFMMLNEKYQTGYEISLY